MGGHGALGVILEDGTLVVVSHALEIASRLDETRAEHENVRRVMSHQRYPLRKAIAPWMHLQSIPQYRRAGQTVGKLDQPREEKTLDSEKTDLHQKNTFMRPPRTYF